MENLQQHKAKPAFPNATPRIPAHPVAHPSSSVRRINRRWALVAAEVRNGESVHHPLPRVTGHSQQSTGVAVFCQLSRGVFNSHLHIQRAQPRVKLAIVCWQIPDLASVCPEAYFNTLPPFGRHSMYIVLRPPGNFL